MACYSLPWRGQSECGCVRTAPSWCAVMEKLPAIGLIQGHLKLFYFVVSEWGWLRESECTVVSGEGTSKEFTSYLCFSLLLLCSFATRAEEPFLFSLLVLE